MDLILKHCGTVGRTSRTLEPQVLRDHIGGTSGTLEPEVGPKHALGPSWDSRILRHMGGGGGEGPIVYFETTNGTCHTYSTRSQTHHDIYMNLARITFAKSDLARPGPPWVGLVQPDGVGRKA